MSTFWNLWIIVLTVISFIGIIWILFGNTKTDRGPDETTGHEVDGIAEYDNPLPAWWLYMFVISIIFSIGYLIVYPGLGNYAGTLGWTQEGQWQKEMAQADEKYGPIFAKYAAMPIEDVAKDPQALKMGQRLFVSNCSQCHGADGKGAYGFPDLTDSEWLWGGDAKALHETLTNGRRAAMPGWEAALGEQGVQEVTQYVLSLGNRASDQTQAEAGKAKFAMFCVACHGAEGKGNIMFGAPDLTNDIWLYGGSPMMIARSIRGGRNGNMPPWDNLLGQERIHLVAAYVWSLSNP